LEKQKLEISHVWVYSKDVPKSIAFYQNTIGLEIAGHFAHGALFRAGTVLLGIHEEEGDRKSMPGGTLIVLRTENIHSRFEQLKEKGVKFLTDHIVSEDFGQVADFRDPDGYLLEIWQPPRKNVADAKVTLNHSSL